MAFLVHVVAATFAFLVVARYVFLGGGPLSLHEPVSNGLVDFDEALESSVQSVKYDSVAGGSKAIVVASVKRENVSWVYENFPDWGINIYVANDPSANLTVPQNTGREAGVYLSYIIDHYGDLPDYLVFIHAKRYQWHNDDPMYDGVNPIKLLRLQHVAEEGYVSLRCHWNPGCPFNIKPDAHAKDGVFGMQAAFAKAWPLLFPEEDVPVTLGAPCCSQFAVTKSQILQRPLEDYVRLRTWLWTTKVYGGKSGRVFEFTWHHIMGKDIVWCRSAAECYCKTFGLCHLTCPDRRRCFGRYKLPPWNRPMPAGWPHKGLGTNGYPKDKWWEKWYPPSEWDGFTPKSLSVTSLTTSAALTEETEKAR